MLHVKVARISARISARGHYQCIKSSLTNGAVAGITRSRFYTSSTETEHGKHTKRSTWSWALGISTGLIIGYGASQSSIFSGKPHINDHGRPTGLDWQGTTHPALGLKTAIELLRRGETSFYSSRNHAQGSSATRTDVNQMASNAPVEDTWTYESADVGDDEKWQFWGIFDGHAGWATSEVLRRSLVSYVARQLQELPKLGRESAESRDSAIKSAFLLLDDEIIASGLNALTDITLSHAEILSRIAPAAAGSCALLAMHDPSTSLLRVACVGDSRAVLGRRKKSLSAEPNQTTQQAQWEARPLSADQTGFNPDEVARIAKEHPGEDKVIDPKSGRVLGIMVSRAFGDNRFKWPLSALEDSEKRFFHRSPRPNYISPPYLVAEPVITTTKIEDGDFVILASDGLWDIMDNEDAVRLVGRWIDETRAKSIKDLEPDHQLKQKSGIEQKLVGYERPYKTAPEFDIVEDKNVATCLVKNALGGNRRDLFCSLLSLKFPDTKEARDDITVQVIFFGDVV